MTAGFAIWTATAVLLLGIGVWTWKAKKAAGFFSGVKPPEVKDVKRYNRAVAVLWFVYAALFELLGLPLLFAAKVWLILLTLPGTALISIALSVAYQRVLAKHRREEHR